MKTFNFHSTNLFYDDWNTIANRSDDFNSYTHNYFARLDVNDDGYTDFVTFPNQGNAPLVETFHSKPLVWIWNEDTGAYEEKGALVIDNYDNSDVYAFPRDVLVNDFDGDGDDDIVLVDPGFENRTLYPDADDKPGSELHFIENTELGLRWADDFFDSDTRSYNHIGDFFDYDKDGDLDIATATFGYRSSTEAPVIHENNGDSTFTTHTDLFVGDAAKPTSGTGFVELANGNTGIALGFYLNENNNTQNEIWEYNAEIGQFEFSSYYKQLPYQGAVDHYNVDVNNDGIKDLIVIYEGLYVPSQGDYINYPDHYQILLQNENSEFVEHQVIANTQDAVSGHLQFDDYNNDGYIDFFIDKNRSEFEWLNEYVMLNNGDGSFSHSSNLNFSFDEWYGHGSSDLSDGIEQRTLQQLLDVNSDGLVDLVTFGQETPVNTGWWENQVGERVSVYLGSLTMEQLVDDESHAPLSSDEGWVVKLVDTLFTDQEQQSQGLVQIGVDFLHQGLSKNDIANAAVAYLNKDNADFIWDTWIGFAGWEMSTPDWKHWTGLLDNNVYTQTEVALIAVDNYQMYRADLSDLFYA